MPGFLKDHPDIVDLERKYQDIAIDQDDLNVYSRQSIIAFLSHSEAGYSINDLISNPLIVVLGEARSGKTTEFQLAADKLSESGHPAFFLRIEDLAHTIAPGTQIVRNALDLNTEDAFDIWLKSDKEAIFFLDSVDEAKLHHAWDYQRAIRTFQKSLRQILHQIRLVVSCRITEWRPRDDIKPLEAMVHLLAATKNQPSGTNYKKQVKLVQIIPLDLTRIELLAHHRGLTDVAIFIDAIREADAMEYAGRPGDAVELIDLWLQEKRLGTLTELVEQNIHRKLSEESAQYEGVISAERAQIGAERLASASILCDEQSFRFAPLEQDQNGALPALEPSILLPEWQPEEIKALLRRPIFDEATYGRVRFHTRSVREYLAASWLRKRFKSGCTANDIINILFANRYGKVAIKPNLTSVAAWLAPNIPEILEYIIIHNPEVLPDEGDPQALPADAKIRVLMHFMKRYGDRNRTGYQFDPHGLRRFAHPDLAESINNLLTEKDATADAKSLLLDLVKIGKIKACVRVAATIALDEGEQSDVRVDAVLALKNCEAREELRKVYLALKSAKKAPERFYAWALFSLYPGVISTDELINLLIMIHSQVATAAHHIKDLLERVIDQKTKASHLKLLVPSLLKLVADSQPKEKNSLGSYYWLYGSLCISVARWLKITEDYQEWIFKALEFIEKQPRRAEYTAEKAIEEIQGIISKGKTSARQSLLWRAYESYAKKHSPGEIHYYKLKFRRDRRFLTLVPDDLGWLLKSVRSETDSMRRFTAFSAAMDLCNRGRGEFDQIEALKAAAKPYPELVEHLKISTMPVPLWPYEYAQKLSNKINQLKKRYNKLKVQEEILPNLGQIAAGNENDLLCRMFLWMDRPRDNYALKEISSLKKLFGRSGMKAFRSGVIKFWPTWKPNEQIRHGDYMAILGVDCSLEDGFDISRIDRETAKRLTLLAFKQIHIQKWFPELIKYHRDAVLSVILPWLKNELNKEQDQHTYLRVLDALTQTESSVLNLFIEHIYSEVNQAMPLPFNTRRYILRILSDERHRHLLASLAFNYLMSINTIVVEDLFWVAVWLQVDALKALDWLEEKLNECDSKETDKIVLSLASILVQKGYSDALLSRKPDYISVEALSRLIPIIYAYVRPEDDSVRHGEWTPNERDNAQSFRGNLIIFLAGIHGEEAYRALLKVRDQISNQNIKDFILQNADQKIGKDAISTWTPHAILEFERDNEHNPHTIDDLFSIGQKRFRAIKDKLERGDFSLRDLFTVKTDESLIQKYLAERLEELSIGRYSVVREAEVDRKKEPDIRLLCSHLPPVSIEVKWAHKWRLAELEEALSVQLVGQYLKAVNSTHGFFVLINANPEKTWSKRGMRKRLDFNGLIDYLSLMAYNIEATTSGVIRLETVGINLT